MRTTRINCCTIAAVAAVETADQWRTATTQRTRWASAALAMAAAQPMVPAMETTTATGAALWAP